VLLLFLYKVHQQSVGRQNYILALGISATVIISFQISIRIIVCCRITNMSNVCCIPTVSATNYGIGLTFATKPMDQYFCWVLAVEIRISQVVDVIDQQSVRRGAAI
jgi:hypothetical protein